MRFNRVDPEAIRFHTILDKHGVQVVEACEANLVDKVLKKFNLTLLSCQGDFTFNSYFLDNDLEEEQVENIEAFIRAEEAKLESRKSKRRKGK